MKRFMRKISAVLIATLLIMTAAPNFAYANDEIDFAPQSETVVESASVLESAPALACENAETSEQAPVEENTPADNQAQEAGKTQTLEQAPVVEDAPVTEQTPTGGDETSPTTDDSIGGNVILNNEMTVPGTDYKAEDALITPENLTILLRGLTEENKINTMLILDKYIQLVVEEGRPLNITGSSFVDAEKYSVGTPGFDSQHCWAATASNILWTTGYAQKAVNPMTNTYFKSEDEVMAYFSDNFTDAPGVPKDGVNWFLNGTGAYSSELQGMATTAHYKESGSGRLLPTDTTNKSWLSELWDYDDPSGAPGAPNAISAVLSVCSQGMGVLVKWIQNGTLSNSAHWMTVVGAIIDDTATTISDKYKALIVADSDSDPAHTESGLNLSATSSEQKLTEKANCTNAYTVYQLKYMQELNANKGGWRLVGFAENGSKIAVLSHFYMILDSDKGPESEGDKAHDYSNLLNSDNVPYSPNKVLTVGVADDTTQSGSCQTPVVEETKDAIVITDGLNAIVIAKEDILSALSEAELETSENLENLLEFMTDNNVEIFPQARGVVSISSGNSYVAYIKTPAAAKLMVSVDGIVLPEDAYEIIVLPNGMTKLRIKNSYLKTLSIGTHGVQINAEGLDTVIGSIINVFE